MRIPLSERYCSIYSIETTLFSLNPYSLNSSLNAVNNPGPSSLNPYAKPFVQITLPSETPNFSILPNIKELYTLNPNAKPFRPKWNEINLCRGIITDRFVLNPMAIPFFPSTAYKSVVTAPVLSECSDTEKRSGIDFNNSDEIFMFSAPPSPLNLSSPISSELLNKTPHANVLNTPVQSELSVSESIQCFGFRNSKFSLLDPSPGARNFYTPKLSEISGAEKNHDNFEEVAELNSTPIILDLNTPDLSECSDTEDTNSTENSLYTVGNEPPDNAGKCLKEIRIKNVNRIVIGTLNINSLSTKFEELKMLISDSLDILVIQETKLDPSFPEDQFFIDGYKKPP